MKSTVIKIVLGIAIVVLGYLLFASIMEAIRFNEELNARNSQVVFKNKGHKNCPVAVQAI